MPLEPPVTTSPTRVVDDFGVSSISGAIGSSNAVASIDSRLAEFIMYGVFNGSFTRGPQNADAQIEVGVNPMPDWYGPVSVSGGAITCSWVADASSPSGYNLRFTVAAGAASDEVYVEQIVPIGGSRWRWTGNAIRAAVLRVAASDDGFQATLATQYLDIDGNPVGISITGTTSWTSNVLKRSYSYVASGAGSPPATARYIRIRLGVKRNTAASAATGTFDLTDVRNDQARPFVMVAEDGTPGTYGPALLSQSNGVLAVEVNSTQSFKIDGATGVIQLVTGASGYVRVDNGYLRLPEIAAPASPAANYLSQWVDTSHHLHTLDSTGVDTDLNALKSIILTADFVKTTGTAGTFADLTGLSFPCVSGKSYLIQGFGTYTCSATTGGINLAYNAPAGTVFAEWEVATTTVNVMEVVVRQAATDNTNAGAASVNSTASHPFRFAIRYACTANGTFTLRVARTGTVNTVTVEAGSGFFVGVA